MTYGKLNTLVGYCGLRLCGGGHCQGCEDRGAELHCLIVWLAAGCWLADSADSIRQGVREKWSKMTPL